MKHSKIGPHRSSGRPRIVSWQKQVVADHRVLVRHGTDRRISPALAAAAPRLADSRHARELDLVLARLTESPHGVKVALAVGRRALVHNRPDDALRSLV